MTHRATAFLGREEACAVLADALRGDRAVLVTGEAGIGKSTLVREAAARAGRRLWAGGGFATLAGMPYVALRIALGSPVTGGPAEVARRVEAAVGDGVLLLDDLQWLDRDTRAVIPILAGRIALVVTSRGRDEGLVAGVPAGALTAVRLGPLEAADAEALVRHVAPDISPAALRRVLARAAGNPLLLEELARDGTESPTAARAIMAHLAEASPGARRAMGLLAVADRPLPSSAIAGHAAELVDLGLVASADDRVAIRHALIAEALLGQLTDDERRAAHLRVARLVDDELDAALHLARGGDPEAGVHRALAALDGTDDHRRRAALLRVAAEAARGPEALELRIRAARAALDVDDFEVAYGLLAAAPDGEPELQGLREARLIGAAHALGRDGDAQEAWRRATALPLEPSGAAAHELAVERAIMLANAGRVADGIGVLDERDAAAVAGDPVHRAARANLRALLGFFAGEDPDLDRLVAWVDEALDAGLPSATTRAANCHGVVFATSGPEAALAFADTYAARLAARSLDPARLLSERVQTLTFTGRAADAVVAADELLERPHPVWSAGWIHVQRAEALCHLGRFDAAESDLEEARPLLADVWMDRGEALTTTAHVAFWSGRLRDAIAAADEALGIPSNYDGNHLLPALVRAWAQADLGHPPAPLPPASPSWVQAAAAAEWTAVDLLVAGRAAVAAFDDATARWSGRHAFRSQLCAWGAGEAARRAGDDSAGGRLLATLDAADAHGFEPIAARARRALRLAGVRVAPASATGDGRELLTRREREVLDLVAGGQSNIEIARRMGLGRPTVARLLSNAMAKLGAETRAQAVTLLHAR